MKMTALFFTFCFWSSFAFAAAPDKKPSEIDISDVDLNKFVPEGARSRTGSASSAPTPTSTKKPEMIFVLPPGANDNCNFSYIAENIRKDLLTLSSEERKNTRYFSLAHLSCLSEGQDEIARGSKAFIKLLNSLSWNKELQPAKTIDPKNTIFRVNLRKYHRVHSRTDRGLIVSPWSSTVWDKIIKVDPYQKLVAESLVADIKIMTDNQFPFVRADWFIAKASRFPLYEDILGILRNREEIEYLLNVDVKGDLARGLAMRAGFESSGVSQNNRIIQRHATDYGAYWLSYDFISSAGNRNIYSFPLGNDDRSHDIFKHDGGEYIFNLPNGLQAYYLTDAKGSLIDKGPIEVVSDPSQKDRKVHNANSCMGCHSNGIIEKTDDVKQSVLNSLGSFNQQTLLAVRSTYANNDRLLEVMTQDQQRFKTALDALGISVAGAEPIRKSTESYEESLSSERAAAELGVSQGTLLTIISLPDFNSSLGPLLNKDSSLKREPFASIFSAEKSHILEKLVEQLAQVSAGSTARANPSQTQALRYILKVCSVADTADYATNIRCMVQNLNDLFTKGGDIATFDFVPTNEFKTIATKIVQSCVRTEGATLEEKHACVGNFISVAQLSGLSARTYIAVCSSFNTSLKRSSCQKYNENN